MARNPNEMNDFVCQKQHQARETEQADEGTLSLPMLRPNLRPWYIVSPSLPCGEGRWMECTCHSSFIAPLVSCHRR